VVSIVVEGSTSILFSIRINGITGSFPAGHPILSIFKRFALAVTSHAVARKTLKGFPAIREV